MRPQRQRLAEPTLEQTHVAVHAKGAVGDRAANRGADKYEAKTVSTDYIDRVPGSSESANLQVRKAVQSHRDVLAVQQLRRQPL